MYTKIIGFSSAEIIAAIKMIDNRLDDTSSAIISV